MEYGRIVKKTIPLSKLKFHAATDEGDSAHEYECCFHPKNQRIAYDTFWVRELCCVHRQAPREATARWCGRCGNEQCDCVDRTGFLRMNGDECPVHHGRARWACPCALDDWWQQVQNAERAAAANAAKSKRTTKPATPLAARARSGGIDVRIDETKIGATLTRGMLPAGGPPRASQLFAATQLVGHEVASGAACCGIATVDGIYAPQSFALVEAVRPRASKVPSWTVAGGTLTASPTGFRVYPGLQLEPGTGVLHAVNGEADEHGLLCDPEIVVTRWNGRGAMPVPVTRTVGRKRESAHALDAFVALCGCLHPWEVDPAFATVDGAWIAASSAIALAAFPRLIAGDAAGAELVLKSVPGPAEYLARRRLAAGGLATSFEAAAPSRALPWTRWSADERGLRATYGAVVVAIVNKFLGAEVAHVENVMYDPATDAAASWWERANISGGACVRFVFAATFTPHAGGGAHACANAGSAFAEQAGLEFVRVPRSDGVVRGESWLHLPAIVGTLEAADIENVAFYVVALMFAGQTREAVVHTCAPQPALPTPPMAPRDFWRGHRVSRFVAGTAVKRDVLPPAVRPIEGPFVFDVEPAEPFDARAAPREARDADVDAAARIVARPVVHDIRVWQAAQAVVERRRATQIATQMTVTPRALDVSSARVERSTDFLGSSERGKASTKSAAQTRIIRFGGPRRYTPVALYVELVEGQELAPAPEPEPVAVRHVVRAVMATPSEVPPGMVEVAPTAQPEVTAAAEARHRCGRLVPARALVKYDTALNTTTTLCAAAALALDPVGAPRWHGDEAHTTTRIDTVRGEEFDWAARLFAWAQVCSETHVGPSTIQATIVGAYLGGSAWRKAIGRRLHVRMLAGELGGVPDGDAVSAQRLATRWSGLGSASQTQPKPRPDDPPRDYRGRDVFAAAHDWIAAAATYINGNATRPTGICVCGKARVTPLVPFAICASCYAAQSAPIKRGGGCLAFSRREGGGHRAVVGFMAEAKIDEADPVRLVRLLYERARETTEAIAVRFPVYPSGQAGERFQETPGIRLTLAAAIAVPLFERLVAPRVCVPRRQPDRVADIVNQFESPHVVVWDATSCSDLVSGPLLRRLAREIAGEGSLELKATEDLTGFDTCDMTESQWARRSVAVTQLRTFFTPRVVKSKTAVALALPANAKRTTLKQMA